MDWSAVFRHLSIQSVNYCFSSLCHFHLSMWSTYHCRPSEIHTSSYMSPSCIVESSTVSLFSHFENSLIFPFCLSFSVWVFFFVFCFFKYCILNIRKTQPMNGGSSSFLFLFSSLFGVVNSVPQKALSTLMTQMTLPIFMYCLWVQRGLKCP